MDRSAGPCHAQQPSPDSCLTEEDHTRPKRGLDIPRPSSKVNSSGNATPLERYKQANFHGAGRRPAKTFGQSFRSLRSQCSETVV
jgi:hypothetical protein